jgi:hypothetical protein
MHGTKAVECFMRSLYAIWLLLALASSANADPADPLAPWRNGVKVSPVSGDDHHAIHAYFNTTPESPDGKFVVFYASTTVDGQEGEVRVRERATGRESVLARGIFAEDAHRAACQQWVAGGRMVAFHQLLPKSNEPVVVAVEVESGKERLLARGRQVGFGQPMLDVLPLYGPHWNPGEHRGIEIVNVKTGDIRSVPVTAAMVKERYPAWVAKQFGDRSLSLFFPLLSPDGSRMLFKVAAATGPDPRSAKASVREGLLGYDLTRSELLFQHPHWGHPAWHSDSRHVLNTQGRQIDSGTGKVEKLPGDWPFPGSHPSYSPDGTLFTTDTLADKSTFGGLKGSWAVVVGDLRTGKYVTLHRFDNSHGARSWRVSHPHPVFSPDGRRIYFNVSDGPWTRLHVAEIQ